MSNAGGVSHRKAPRGQNKGRHERAPCHVRDQVDDGSFLSEAKVEVVSGKVLRRACKIGQGHWGACRTSAEGCEGTLRLTSAHRRHRVVESRHRVFEDQPATSHESEPCDLTLVMRGKVSSKHHMRSGTCASSRPFLSCKREAQATNPAGHYAAPASRQAAEKRRAERRGAAELYLAEHTQPPSNV